MAGSHDASLESHDPEYMDERWADDEELMMDVDMTTEMQQEVFQLVPSHFICSVLITFSDCLKGELPRGG